MTGKKIPMRQCIGCGEMKAKKDMIRILKVSTTESNDADGTEQVKEEIILDATGRKNGRGAYICPSSECMQKAIKGKGLERSFKRPIPKEVYEMLTKEMEELENR